MTKEKRKDRRNTRKKEKNDRNVKMDIDLSSAVAVFEALTARSLD